MNKEQQRFFSHVVKGPSLESCWIWTGAISDDGYGIFWRQDPETKKDTPIRAHRYALSLIQPELTNLHALHRCDNTLCVKATATAYTHLTAGTRAENMTDRSKRGRSNFQNRKTTTKADRAEAARSLRAITLKTGYSQQAIDQLMKGIPPNQLALF
ncbi:hypothetical protein [Rothia nasisuis]|uniref:hypothetical protein n=1 Tax=Rothia nasisuis TaxID=2109647 RepID=UPI001F3D6E9E|nr:hypothetical protein [Rothia nasisuis]